MNRHFKVDVLAALGFSLFKRLSADVDSGLVTEGNPAGPPSVDIAGREKQAL